MRDRKIHDDAADVWHWMVNTRSTKETKNRNRKIVQVKSYEKCVRRKKNYDKI